MAEGVKGLVMARRLILVVCAFVRAAASRRTWRGFGGEAMGVEGAGRVEVGARRTVKWVRVVSVDVRRVRRAAAWSGEEGAIVGTRDVSLCLSWEKFEKCFKWRRGLVGGTISGFNGRGRSIRLGNASIRCCTDY